MMDGRREGMLGLVWRMAGRLDPRGLTRLIGRRREVEEGPEATSVAFVVVGSGERFDALIAAIMLTSAHRPPSAMGIRVIGAHAARGRFGRTHIGAATSIAWEDRGCRAIWSDRRDATLFRMLIDLYRPTRQAHGLRSGFSRQDGVLYEPSPEPGSATLRLAQVRDRAVRTREARSLIVAELRRTGYDEGLLFAEQRAAEGDPT